MKPTASGRGDHLAAGDGGPSALGDAALTGSAAGARLAAPVVGAPFLGSLGGARLDSKVVGLATVPR